MTEKDQLTASYDFALPEASIAQNPMTPRDHSRLLVVTPEGERHCHFYDLPELLQPGDLLVLNDTRVIPARLFGKRATGGQVEVLLIEARTATEWLCLLRPARRLSRGSQLSFGGGLLDAEVLETDPKTGGRWVRFDCGSVDFSSLLAKLGQLPLPPYIQNSTARPDQYQTIWATRPGAVAAPTAGLHFTPELLARLTARGILQTTLTLHVGLGTFRPVQTERLADHTMHSEWFEIPDTTVAALEGTRCQGGRIVAVGTTSARALETAAAEDHIQSGQRRSELFIHPGYRWRVVQGLVTNFHLPRSSLMMLVSSLTGRERLLTLYQEAIDRGYRFYSFGDAMLILP